MVHGTVKKLHMPKFWLLLEERVVYVIQNFRVIRSLGSYQVVHNHLKVSFLMITNVNHSNNNNNGEYLNLPFLFIDLNVRDSRINDPSFLSSVCIHSIFVRC